MITITTPDRTAVADVLEKAATHIDLAGWIQGAMYAAELADAGTPVELCPVCAVGAIKTAILGAPRWGGSDEQMDLSNAARAAVEEFLDLEVDSVASWNDDPDRTIDEVTAALRATAASLRGEGV